VWGIIKKMGWELKKTDSFFFFLKSKYFKYLKVVFPTNWVEAGRRRQSCPLAGQKKRWRYGWAVFVVVVDAADHIGIRVGCTFGSTFPPL
jgi:hypothetical protein